MAHRKIREYDAKQLIQNYISQNHNFPLSGKGILVTPQTNLPSLPQQHPWLLTTPLVIKPDQLFGKRGKLGLIGTNLNYQQVQEFISNHNTEITIGNATGKLTHFLIEPYIKHKTEYYLAISSNSRDGNNLYFSYNGGIDIEENWTSVATLFLATGTPLETEKVKEFLQMRENVAQKIITEKEKTKIITFIQTMYTLFLELDFTYLEFNPFTFNEQEEIIILDTVAQVDDCASFKHPLEWKNLTFPKAFGQTSFPEEQYIEHLNKESGASLKLTLLNPRGRIWNILSGGGASIIYLDTIADLGKQQEIANYGEYSGNPTTEESYQYAKTILDLMTRTPHPQGKILIIGGAIANFTDVEKTFRGIINALREYQEKLRLGKISIFVRRGGPNYERALQLIEQAGKEMNIPMIIKGPDSPMIEIVGKAMERLQ